MQLLANLLISILKGYLIKLASKEFIEYVIFEAAEAAVKSTKTKHDDKFLAKIKEVVTK